MSCSKLFSGNLPELTYYILKFLRNDIITLHSCILVNKLWCRLAIPLLWENPFSTSTENSNFIDIYLDNLNDDLRTKLDEYKINANLLPSNTLFNYPSFIKYFITNKFICTIEHWFTQHAFKILKPEIFINFQLQLECKKLIQMLLIITFIKNVENLHTLEIVVSIFNPYLDSILQIILLSQNFFHNIKNLNLYIYAWENSRTKILYENRILQVIKSHQNLKKILFKHECSSYFNSLLLSNYSNTLNIIILLDVNFDSIDLGKLIEQSNVLESIHISNCSINTSLAKQIVSLSKPLKLKSLYMKDILNINSLQLLFQKSGDYLENFGYNFSYNYDLSLKQQLLELVAKYCKNIKFLDLFEFRYKVTYPIFNLIENIKQNLKYLNIELTCEINNVDDDINECSSIILQNLGKTFPSKLEHLDLCLPIKANDFEEFLKSIQDTFIKKLSICSREGDDILVLLPYLKQYIMKNKSVKYLAIMNSFYIHTANINETYNGKDLFELKDEVKEFELYNIEVQNYCSNKMVDIMSNFVLEID